jgi:hypothetical protein
MPAFYPMDAGGFSQGVKREGRETDHSPPSSGEFKNGGATPPLLHISSWLNASSLKHRDNFTFIGMQFDLIFGLREIKIKYAQQLLL